MTYETLADAYARIEATSSRLTMTRLLADLFRKASAREIGQVVYLTQGRLYPHFAGIELGVAEKTAARVVAQAAGEREAAVTRRISRRGDLGTVAEELLRARTRRASRRTGLGVGDVYGALDRVARAGGEASQAARLKTLAELLARATPLEAKYIVRTMTGRLRLGVGDMTVLDALASAFGEGGAARKEAERAYNLTSDLGEVAAAMARGGLRAIRGIEVTVGKPIRPMLAERLPDPKQILEKLGGRCAAEYKYDGERLQIHKQGREVTLFSRRLERITPQYPDVADLVSRHVRARAAIVEGEVVAIDAASGDLRPFQELMPRRRKYGIERAMEEIPTALFLFDALALGGRDLTGLPYSRRRAALERVVSAGDRCAPVTSRAIDSDRALADFFDQAVQDGCEGLICKAPEGVYQAGARGWLWIKLKREYHREMQEPVDLAVVGAFHGRGRRGGTYGALLMAAYDDRDDMFRTVCKLGSGFSDTQLAALPRLLRPHVRSGRPRRVESRVEPDVWCEPAVVLEVIGGEITLSPVHTAGWGRFREGAGLAVRFPRLTRYREDKGPQDATTVREIGEMYARQRRRPSSDSSGRSAGSRRGRAKT